MDLRPIIKEVGRGAHGARELPEDIAEKLFGALLDGEVADLELGAILLAYRIKGETVSELRAFARALAARTARLELPEGDAGQRPVLLPSYNGARKLPNLTPLLALLLARRGVPVLIHGISADYGRTTTEAILTELGIRLSASIDDVDAHLLTARIAYAPLDILAPGLARLLAVRERIGLRSSGHTVAKLFDPFGTPADDRSVLAIPVTHPDYIALMRDYLRAAGGTALLFRGHEGEPCAGPRRPLEVDAFVGGEHRALHAERPPEVPLPEAIDARTTAVWTRQALAGEAEIPATVLKLVDWCEAAAKGVLPAV